MHETFNASEWLLDRRVEAGDGERTAIVTGGRTFTYAEVLVEVERTAAAPAHDRGPTRGAGGDGHARLAGVRDRLSRGHADRGRAVGHEPAAPGPRPGRDRGRRSSPGRGRVGGPGRPGRRPPDRGTGAGDHHSDRRHPHRRGRRRHRRHRTRRRAARLGRVPGGRRQRPGRGDRRSAPSHLDRVARVLALHLGLDGQPKLAMHRHGDIKVTCETYAAGVLGIGRDDVCLSVGPMFHAYGLGNSDERSPSPPARRSCSFRRRPDSPTATLVAEIVTTHQPTLLFTVPTLYAAINSPPTEGDPERGLGRGPLRCVSAGEAAAGRDVGPPLPRPLRRRDPRRHRLDRAAAHLRVERTGADQARHQRRSVPGYEVRVVDEHGNDQPAGQPGQLLVRGGSLATGYWCRTDTNHATFEGPWMRTGDLYVCDDDGFHTYLGRVDDMLRVGGEWVSPAEVEGVLIEHPSVLEAAVVGERDADGVLRPVAHVIPIGADDGGGGELSPPKFDGTALASELTEFCRSASPGSSDRSATRSWPNYPRRRPARSSGSSFATDHPAPRPCQRRCQRPRPEREPGGPNSRWSTS